MRLISAVNAYGSRAASRPESSISRASKSSRFPAPMPFPRARPSPSQRVRSSPTPCAAARPTRATPNRPGRTTSSSRSARRTTRRSGSDGHASRATPSPRTSWSRRGRKETAARQTSREASPSRGDASRRSAPREERRIRSQTTKAPPPSSRTASRARFVRPPSRSKNDGDVPGRGGVSERPASTPSRRNSRARRSRQDVTIEIVLGARRVVLGVAHVRVASPARDRRRDVRRARRAAEGKRGDAPPARFAPRRRGVFIVKRRLGGVGYGARATANAIAVASSSSSSSSSSSRFFAADRGSVTTFSASSSETSGVFGARASATSSIRSPSRVAVAERSIASAESSAVRDRVFLARLGGPGGGEPGPIRVVARGLSNPDSNGSNGASVSKIYPRDVKSVASSS